MNKNFLLLVGLFVVLLVVTSVIGVWFYLFCQKVIQLQPLPQECIITPKPVQFSPLKSPPSPPFLKSLNDAKDVKINFHYEGDYPSFFGWPNLEFYTPEGSNEKFLSLSKIKREVGRYVYGPDYYSIFHSEGTHWYGGSPIYLLSLASKYSVSYVGIKINNRDLISELKIEFGIDYDYRDGEDTIGKSKSSIFTSIFGVEPIYACGPGVRINLIGHSNLIFIYESNGITWYRLEKPISLYNLPLSYCGNIDCSSLPDCPLWAEPPPGCEDYPSCCHWNVTISDLAHGNLRMHIFYKPNDKEGFLKLQVVNLILSDPTGIYYQPIMGENFDHYYRAFLR